MFKRLRIAFLLYVLLFVAAAQYFAARRSTDWDDTLWVDVYPVNADGSAATQRYMEQSASVELDGVDEFFVAEAHRHGLALARPFRFNLLAPYTGRLPELPPAPSAIAVLWWSLEMRWLALKMDWQSSGPSPDIVVFAVYHDSSGSAVLDRSTALRKGLIAVTNLFAARGAGGSNRVVLAHELLHTLGATDKYSLDSDLPVFPDGYADPSAKPLLPQSRAELMAGRIPLDQRHAEIPESLKQVVIGNLTAAEIGWPHP